MSRKYKVLEMLYQYINGTYTYEEVQIELTEKQFELFQKLLDMLDDFKF